MSLLSKVRREDGYMARNYGINAHIATTQLIYSVPALHLIHP